MKTRDSKRKILFISIILILFGFAAFAAELGDVNENGSIDIIDALLVAQYSVGQTPANFNPAYANVNCMGSIDIVDALLIAQYSVGQISKFPCATATPTRTPTLTPTPTMTSTKLVASQVVFIGDSVIALSKEIPKDLNTLARNDGTIGPSDSFRDYSVSGMRLAGGGSPTIPQQYNNAKNAGTVKYVIMDGGGNDCLQASCSSPVTSSCSALVAARDAFQNLLKQMANDGVKAVVFMRYYNAPADPREKLLVLMPMMETVANATTTPKVYWLDLRNYLNTTSDISGDGLHPSSAGCQKIANAVWSAVKQNNLFN